MPPDKRLEAQEILDRAQALGLSVDEPEAYVAAVQRQVADAEGILDFPTSRQEPVSRQWSVPSAQENPLNAWYVRTEITEATSGPLAGKTVAIKDNIRVAGVPLMNGTKILEGYVPQVDATVVTRLLGAGATIAGKSTCNAYCFSGGSHVSDTGPVLNPHDPERSAGGSSSGSAALVASGGVDYALGCDQGGSVRVPASFCGLVGMKATHGLVPYTGILGMAPGIDHVGPITRTVAENALVLSVLANSEQVFPKTSGVQGLRIGLVSEGFGRPTSETVVDDSVRTAVHQLSSQGASVSEVSIPLHLAGAPISAALAQLVIDNIFTNDGQALGGEPVDEAFLRQQAQWRTRPNDLPQSVQVSLVSREILRQRHGTALVGRALEETNQLRAAYDTALEDFDLLVMPTTPMRATRLPGSDAGLAEVMTRSGEPLSNTRPFNNTGHPAMSLPCGFSDGLPIGLMLIGAPHSEALLYQTATTLEENLTTEKS